MRILIYNFVQPEAHASKQCGGVCVYSRNLIAALLAQGHQVISLNSGDRYTFFRQRPRLVIHGRGALSRCEIFNAPVFAPLHYGFHAIEAYARSDGLNGIPAELRRAFGDIDVFHFQVVEGLTAGFFHAIRAEFPQSRLLLSAHNYGVICPQVNLWFREHRVCTDFREGRACVNCLHMTDPTPYLRNTRRVGWLAERLGFKPAGRLNKAVQFVVRCLLYVDRQTLQLVDKKRPPPANPRAIMSPDRAAIYAGYRGANIELCQTVFDWVLAVSARTRQVLIERGMAPDNIAVSYIGTSQFVHLAGSYARRTTRAPLHIAYLGYMRADKGFFFLLECLFALPEAVTRDMAITIAAPMGDPWPVERLKGLAHKFRAVTLYNGYTHATLDKVLEGVTLGVIPVIWEDNLPQVAIEMAVRGIPLLTSDRGGAQEIAANPAFVFKANSVRAFCQKITDVATGRLALQSYWDNPLRVFSMADHVEDLMRYYRPIPTAGEIYTPTSAVGRARAPASASVALQGGLIEHPSHQAVSSSLSE